MGRKNDIKIILDTYGNYLGMKKGCIVLSDKDRNETRYPLVEDIVGEIVLNSGNMISTGLLCYLGFWGIDVLVSTRYGINFNPTHTDGVWLAPLARALRF